MNLERAAGIGRQFKGELKLCWGRLNGDSTTAAAGMRERLVGRIQEQRGIVKETTERELRDFMSRNRNWRHLSD